MNKVVEPVATATLKEDGGQAFPHGDPTHGGDIGMSLRDYFAAQALAGWLASSVDLTMAQIVENPEGPRNIAKLSYLVADAMIAERTSSTSPKGGS